jgi:hypothetical protein
VVGLKGWERKWSLSVVEYRSNNGLNGLKKHESQRSRFPCRESNPGSFEHKAGVPTTTAGRSFIGLSTEVDCAISHTTRLLVVDCNILTLKFKTKIFEDLFVSVILPVVKLYAYLEQRVFPHALRNLETDRHLVQLLRMCGVIPPLPYVSMASCFIKHKENLRKLLMAW